MLLLFVSVAVFGFGCCWVFYSILINLCCFVFAFSFTLKFAQTSLSTTTPMGRDYDLRRAGLSILGGGGVRFDIVVMLQ